MRTAIFTEGSTEWGMGHLNRCLGFAQRLTLRGSKVDWFVHGDEVASSFLADHGLSGEIVDWGSELPKGLSEVPTELVIVDSYHAPASRYEEIARLVPCRLWLDDEARITYPPGHVLTPNPLVRHQANQGDANGVRILSGFEFQPLRSEFIPPPSFRRIPETIGRILVSMGGTDIRGLTPLVVSTITATYPGVELLAIVPRDDQRAEWCELESPHCRLLPACNALQMRERMESCDLAVSAAGQTLLECLRLGLPSIALEIAGNQRIQTEALLGAHSIEFAGRHDSPNLKESLRKSLRLVREEHVREQLSRAGAELIDGCGIDRTLAAMGF